MLLSKLEAIIKPAVEALGYCVWGCNLKRHGQRSVLTVYIDDAKKAPNMEALTQLNRQIGAVLEVEDLIGTPYTLEVSSPGMDRRLFCWEHYTRVQGEQIRVRLREAIEGRRQFTGILSALSNEDRVVTLTFEDGITQRFAFDVIESANVVPKF